MTTAQPTASYVLKGPDDRETFEAVPGKWFYAPGGAITGMTVFSRCGRVKAKWGDEIHYYRGDWFVGPWTEEVARRAARRNRALLAFRCRICGRFLNQTDWFVDCCARCEDLS